MNQYLRAIFIVTVIALTSCAGLKPKTKDVQIVKADTQKPVVPTATPKKDTVAAKTTTPTPKPQVVVPKTPPKAPPAMTYQIAMILPLDARSNSINATKNLRFIQYYGGTKIAADQLAQEDISLNIDVMDGAGFSTGSLSKTYDLIIGPYASASDEASKNLLQEVLAFAKTNQIFVAQPWYSSSKTTEDNPYFIQLKPNVREYMVSIMQHAAKEFRSNEIVLVGRASDTKVLEYLQALAKSNFGTEVSTLSLTEQGLNGAESSFSTALTSGKKVFIFPNFSFNDENYLQKALSKLSSEKAGKEVFVYGMPIIIDSDKIGINLYNALNMRIASPDYVDRDDIQAQEFIRQYFERFKTIPASDAFEGRDMLLFLGRALSKYGSKELAVGAKFESGNYLQTSYNIQAVYDGDNFANIDFYENKHLYILGFSGGKFRKL